MRIGVNARFLYSSQLEGIGRYSFETTYRMIKKYPQHTFVLFYDRRPEDLFEGFNNVEKVIVPPPARHPVLWNIWFEWTLPAVLKNKNVDVFYSPDGFLSVRSKVPTVMVSHDLAYLHYPEHTRRTITRYYQKWVPKFHSRANHIIAVSEATKVDIVNSYGLAEKEITVAYNAVSDGFKPIEDKSKIRKKYASDQPYFIYLGSLHPRKNILNLIKSFERFKTESGLSHKLVLVGRMAWNTKEIKEGLEQSCFEQDIIHLNNVGREIKEILAGAEAMVYISLFEGFGIPIIEAMSCGVPVICSGISSMPEVAGESALLVDPIDIKDIAHKMKDLATDSDLRTKLQGLGYENIKRFSWDKTAAIIFDKLHSQV